MSNIDVDNYTYNQNQNRIIRLSIQKYITTIDSLLNDEYTKDINKIIVAIGTNIEDGENMFKQNLVRLKVKLINIIDDPSLLMVLDESDISVVRMFLYDILDYLSNIQTENMERNIDDVTDLLKKMLSESMDRGVINQENFVSWFML